ncbi:ribosomal protein S18 acetylase RimI-like enzyme [Aeromonas sp. BIGb0405]|nr:ribosomal protein S18 acetylase RimI-like enzyme [Aeromonas sp. BIGb0405]
MDPGQLPLALLLEADPAEEQTAEIFNIAVAPNRQQQSIGSGLLLAYQATHVKHLICERCGETFLEY